MSEINVHENLNVAPMSGADARKSGAPVSEGLFGRIYAYVSRVPVGKVVTYGQVAAAVGAPRCARQVGWALHQNPRPGEIPCHRVVNRQGRLAPAFAFGGTDAQARLLAAEGVTVRDGYVDLNVYLWRE